MFNALFKVCESSSPARTQRERFTTEAFCGVLRSDPRLLESFLRDFAGIENETGFAISTEKSYDGSFIDVVFENKNYLIFLEVKVDSSEGKRGERNQLEVYTDILKNQSKKPILLFCTKFLETKNPSLYHPLQFYQFLWCDIYSHTQQYISFQKNTLACELLNYLESQNMNRALEFSLQDLDALNKIPNLLKSLEECLDQIRPNLQKHFGEINPRSLKAHKNPRIDDRSSFYSQLYVKTRYAIWHEKPLKDKKYWSEILASITMGNAEKNNPKVQFQFYVDKNYPSYVSIVSEFTNNQAKLSDAHLIEKSWGFSVLYEKPLASFLSEPEQFLAVKKWYQDKIQNLYAYMKNHSELDWDIK